MQDYFIDLIDRLIEKQLNGIYTAIPAKVVSYDIDKQIVDVEPLVLDVDGGELPTLTNLPLFNHGGAKYAVIVEVSEGDEGMVLVSSRSIDEWVKDGVKSESKLRKFSLNDAIFLCGVRPKNRAFKGMENNGIRLCSNDNKHYAWLKDDGNFYCSGDIYSKGEKVTRISHKHPFTGYNNFKGTTEQAEE